MKIKEVNTYLVRPRWCFVEIVTDEGLCGWGEAVIEGKASTVKACVEEMTEYLIDVDPMRIEDIWNTLYRAGFYRGGPVIMSAISGIDQALWDIKGKYYNAPVYELMGGRCRDKMKVYSWIGGDRPSDVAAAALERNCSILIAMIKLMQYLNVWHLSERQPENILELLLIFMEEFISLWQRFWRKSWKNLILCL